VTKKRLVPWLLLLLACSVPQNASAESPPRGGPPIRVLFIGNSYTYCNDLPGMLARLAAAGGIRAETAMAAVGGWTLAAHAASVQTLQTIHGTPWNYVVLQEQSEVPAIERARVGSMYPAVRSLVQAIAAAGGTPLLFLTWGHREGLPGEGCMDFESMQRELAKGYTRIAQELEVGVAPVGTAWQQARKQQPQTNLWEADGSHPNIQGSYLAACVLYATMFKTSPVALSYIAGLPNERARVLQSIAEEVVLNKRTR